MQLIFGQGCVLDEDMLAYYEGSTYSRTVVRCGRPVVGAAALGGRPTCCSVPLRSAPLRSGALLWRSALAPSPPPPPGALHRACRFVVLSAVLSYFEQLCREVPPTGAASGAAAADVGAWARSMHRVLSLMTEAFGGRVRGIVSGLAAGGPAASYE